MRFFDLHCDTLYKSTTQNIPLNSNSLEVLLNLKKDDHRLQCYAIWLPDDLTENKAEKLFDSAYLKIKNECRKHNIKLLSNYYDIRSDFESNQYSAFFTVENGSALNGKIENIERFANLGVKMITLTWNGQNSIGSGADISNSIGLTDFGRLAVREMERNRIIVDISHASKKLFYDVAALANRPFVASHSNSHRITPHRRNLTDEQFTTIVDRKGIVGINFHKDFLSSDSQKANKYDVVRHIEHFLSIGGENTVCIGSDFDGCDLPKDIENSNFLFELYEILLRENYKESLIRKIFYNNALNFFENFDN